MTQTKPLSSIEIITKIGSEHCLENSLSVEENGKSFTYHAKVYDLRIHNWVSEAETFSLFISTRVLNKEYDLVGKLRLFKQGEGFCGFGRKELWTIGVSNCYFSYRKIVNQSEIKDSPIPFYRTVLKINAEKKGLDIPNNIIESLFNPLDEYISIYCNYKRNCGSASCYRCCLNRLEPSL